MYPVHWTLNWTSSLWLKQLWTSVLDDFSDHWRSIIWSVEDRQCTYNVGNLVLCSKLPRDELYIKVKKEREAAVSDQLLRSETFVCYSLNCDSIVLWRCTCGLPPFLSSVFSIWKSRFRLNCLTCCFIFWWLCNCDLPPFLSYPLSSKYIESKNLDMCT